MIVDMGKRGPKPSMDRRDEALQLRLEGLTFAAIAKQLGVSRQRVQQILAPPRDVRDSVVIGAQGRCSACELFVGTAGHVHHLQATSIEDEDYNDHENLTLLCRSCHRTAHRGEPSNTLPRIRRETEMVYGKPRAPGEPTLYTEIGEQIMLARRRALMNQSDLAARLGISHAAVSDIERGKTRPNLDNLEEIAMALGVPLSQLVVIPRGQRAAQHVDGGSGG